MEEGKYRKKLCKSVRFCTKVVRRTIEGRIFLSTQDTSKNKEEAVSSSQYKTGSQENKQFRQWRENQEREKAMIRRLDYYPKTPERPPKKFKNKSLPLQTTRKSTKHRKPKLPTPPESPEPVGRVQSMSCKVSSTTTTTNATFASKHASQESKYEEAPRLPRPPASTSTNYLSDDSGVGTCNTSDFSDDCGNSNVSDSCDVCLGFYNDSNQTNGHRTYKIRGSKRQISPKHKSPTSDKMLLKEKEMFCEVKCIMLQKLSTIDSSLVDIINRLGLMTSSQEEERVYRYVLDVERITMLMSSLARRLARTELRMRMAGFKNYKEIRTQISKIQDQLNEANVIDRKLKEKSDRIAQEIEKYLGVRTKTEFFQLVNHKSNLLILSKELDDKISLCNDHFIIR